MTTISDPTERWQKAFAQDIYDREENHRLYLRLSSSGQCIRRLYYVARDETPTDPPNETVKNQLVMGHALEVLAIMNLHKHGWETKHTCLDEGGQVYVEVEVEGRDAPIGGHPDGSCRHEVLTDNHWLPLELKSMSDFRASRVEEFGISKVEPSYVMQIAMYGHTMKNLGMVDLHDRGIFGLISRNGRFLPPERLKWPADLHERGRRRLSEVILRAERGDPPPRPYDENSVDPPCNFCPFKTICWEDKPNAALQPVIRGEPTPMDHDQELVDAMLGWQQAKQTMDQAKALIGQRLSENNDVPISAAGIKAEYFRPGESNAYDMYEIGRYLTADILRNNRSKKGQERVLWVHTQ